MRRRRTHVRRAHPFEKVCSRHFDPAYNDVCSICKAPPGFLCKDEETGQAMFAIHGGRIFGPGPIVIRRVGTTPTGEGIFEQVP